MKKNLLFMLFIMLTTSIAFSQTTERFDLLLEHSKEIITTSVTKSIVRQNGNPALSFSTTPLTTATVGVGYTYSAFATDGSEDNPTMTCPIKPDWLTFSATGSTSEVQFGETIVQPGGIAGDANGNTYVVSNNTTSNGGYVYKIAPDGTTDKTWAQVDEGLVYAMNADDDYLYVSYYSNNTLSNSCLRKISLSNPGAGQTTVYSVSSSNFLSLAFKDGYIYAANYSNGKIIKIDPGTGTASDFVSVQRPFGIGFNSNGDLYIASYDQGIIYKYDGTTLSTVISGLGTCSDVKIDRYDYLYVSRFSGGIRKYAPTAYSTHDVIVPEESTNRIWGMNLAPNGSLAFGLYSQNICARIGTGATISGTPAVSDIGPHNVVITATNTTSFLNQEFVVTVQGPPTLSNFPDLNGAIGTNFDLTDPSSNSNGAFSYESSNTAVATISGNTVSPLTAGTTTITATQAADGNYTSETISCTLTVTDCTNPTSGGTIAENQFGCSSLDPEELTSASLPTGHAGTLEYKWQQSTTSSTEGFSDIASSNSATYDPSTITTTTWYKRLARVSCKSDWTGAAESNVIEINITSLAPTITTTPALTVAYDNTYSYSVVATIDGNEETTLSAPTLPEWMTFSTEGQSQASLFGNIPSGVQICGVAGDDDGNIYAITQNGTSIYKISPDGTTTLWRGGLISGTVYALHIANGYIYIPRYMNSTQSITRIPLSNPSAAEETFASFPGGALSLTDKDGWIYATDWNYNTIYKIEESSKTSQSILTTADGILSGGPFGLTFDENGNLFIATWNNRSISKWDGSSMTTVLSGLPSSVSSIRQDIKGNFYLSMAGGGVRKYTNDFSLVEVVSLSSTDNIWSLSFTSSGALVYAKYNTNEVYRLQTGAIITGTPSKSKLGDHPVVIRATNCAGFTEQSFTVTVIDTIPPEVTLLSPLDGATEVALQPTLSATFDEGIFLGTTGTFKLISGGTTLKTFDLSVANDKSAFTVSADNRTISVDITDKLPTNSLIAVEASAGFVRDSSDNQSAEVTAASGNWDFTTLDNDIPEGSAISDQVTCYETAITDLSLSITDSYPGDETFTVTGESSNTDLIENTGITITGTGSSRTISLTPKTGASGTATITIYIKDSEDVEGSVDFDVTVYPEFVVGSISSDQAICYNTIPSKLEGVAPTGGGNLPTGIATPIPASIYDYQWQVSTDGTAFNDITGATTIDYQPGALTATTYYQLVQSSACGEETTNTVTIIVHPEFVVGSISDDQFVCGSTIPDELIGVAPTGGNTPYTYQWQISINGTTFADISGATDLNYQPGSITVETYYQLVQSSATGCGQETTNMVTIGFYPALVAGSISADQTICYNTTPDELIGVAPTGADGTYTYQWQSSADNSTFTDITGATDLNYQPGALTATTYYQMVQTSVGGCGDVTTNVVTITLYPDFVVGSISSNQHICYNTTPAELIGAAPTGGSGNNTYQWQVSTNGSTFTDISGATDLNYQPGALTATTYYQLVQTSVGGCGEETTNMVTITVYPEFIKGSISGTQTICYDTSPDELIGVAPTGADGDYDYQWRYSIDGTTFSDVSGATGLDYQAGDLTQTTHYQLIQTSAYGCGAFTTNKITVSVRASVAKPVILEKKMPNNVSILFVDNSANLYNSYLWSYADESSLPSGLVNNRQFLTLPIGHMDATYMVTAFDQNACGLQSLSKTVTPNQMASSVYPTISNGKFTVDLVGPETGKINVRIFDEYGKVLKTYEFEKMMTIESIPINVNDFNVGSYLIEISINSYKEVHRVFIR